MINSQKVAFICTVSFLLVKNIVSQKWSFVSFLKGNVNNGHIDKTHKCLNTYDHTMIIL